MDALAKILDAEILASRTLVDTSYIGHARQGGQTDKTEHPYLYFAFGISGTI